MPPGPAPADPGRDESRPGTPPGPDRATPPGDPVGPGWEPVITRPDPMSEEEREAWLDALAGEDEPFDPEEYPDPDGPPPPGQDELTPGEIAGIGEAAEAEARGAANGARSGATEALAAIAAYGNRRGPGQPGGRVFLSQVRGDDLIGERQVLRVVAGGAGPPFRRPAFGAFRSVLPAVGVHIAASREEGPVQAHLGLQA